MLEWEHKDYPFCPQGTALAANHNQAILCHKVSLCKYLQVPASKVTKQEWNSYFIDAVENIEKYQAPKKNIYNIFAPDNDDMTCISCHRYPASAPNWGVIALIVTKKHICALSHTIKPWLLESTDCYKFVCYVTTKALCLFFFCRYKGNFGGVQTRPLPSSRTNRS